MQEFVKNNKQLIVSIMNDHYSEYGIESVIRWGDNSIISDDVDCEHGYVNFYYKNEEIFSIFAGISFDDKYFMDFIEKYLREYKLKKILG